MFVYLRSIKEDKPGEKWQKQFEKAWPYYKKWFVSEGYKARPTYLESSKALEKYMPELFPLYENLCELAGGGDLEARFLSQFNPPPFMSSCSQIAYTKQSNVLIRNYDYSPTLFEGALLYTQWKKKVIGFSDCLWGLLDGFNEDGLSVSLTFGGRKFVGNGFGIPLVIRYVLETCSSTTEAIEAFARVPVHMTYNITLLDKLGNYNTIFLSPDKEMLIANTPIGTNHQEKVEWEDYARVTETIKRLHYLEECLLNPTETEYRLIKKFLQPPLYSTQFERNFGTLYTSVYRVDEGKMEVHWPQKTMHQSFDNFTEKKESILLGKHFSDKLTQ